MMKQVTVLLWLSLACIQVAGVAGGTEDYPPPAQVELNHELGRGVQRTIKRLEESTPACRNTVRILFYGQSITEQAWAGKVTEALRKRYPNANLIVENRAIGGFSSNLLVMTAESDLYPFYPDLLIFYDYGRHDCYEDILRRTRERTTAEILLQNDHVGRMSDMDEELDPSKLSMKQWSSWFPNVFIPSMAEKYHTGMVQQRALWKLYARQVNVDPRNLTVDGCHLNEQGNWLMSGLVSAYLVRRPLYDEPDVDRQIRDYLPGTDWAWQENTLVLPFVGNKIDMIPRAGSSGSVRVFIDGKKPSLLPELYNTSRVSGFPGIGWPIISHVGHEKPLVLETWSATATEFSPDGKRFKFKVSGSVTGADGEGTSDKRFVSDSGRVVIEPEAWNMAYSFGLLQGPWSRDNHKVPFTIPDRVVATWTVVPFFMDEFSAASNGDPTSELVMTLAQGLANGPHELQLVRSGQGNIRALRVYQPPLKALEPSRKIPPSHDLENVPQSAPPIQQTGADRRSGILGAGR